MFRYHPDKNGNDPKASDMFKEIVYSYNILSDPEKRQQYDSAGFEVCLLLKSFIFRKFIYGILHADII